MSEEIIAKNGKVITPTGGCGGYGCQDVDEYTPDSARRWAAELVLAADLADEQIKAIAAACEDGHDWDTGFNRTWRPEKVTVYHCQRDGCEGEKEEPGWLPFEPKTHMAPDQFAMYLEPAECTGPGCEHCSNEAMADAFHNMLGNVKIERGGIAFPASEPDLAVFAKEAPPRKIHTTFPAGSYLGPTADSPCTGEGCYYCATDSTFGNAKDSP